MGARTRVRLAVGLLVALLVVGTGCGRGSGAPERIVLIVVDTLRADRLSPYGGDVETPHIQALADRGQVFTHFVASFHQTSMSMASLFTGRTPSLETGVAGEALDWTGRNWCGFRRLRDGDEDTCVPQRLSTLAEGLRDAGYWTAAVATNAYLFRPYGYDQGFDRWVEVGERPTDAGALLYVNGQTRRGEIANAAAAELLARRPSNHFFLYVHYMDVHDYKQLGVSYAEGVRRADRAVGHLLALLRRHGLAEGTLVILASDHGERLGERHLVEGSSSHLGNPSFEELLRLPLIVAPPLPGVDPGRTLRSDDLHRLIRRVAGAADPPPADLDQGELFLSEQEWQTYRRGRWKSFRRRDTGELFLVDLDADPGERSDVARQHPEISAEHARRLDALTRGLGAGRVAPSSLTSEDERRLRSLGYLE
jgi:arylsulfatase A-like enzyme